MKKILICLLVAALSFAIAPAKTAEDILKEFKQEKDVEFVHMPSLITKLALRTGGQKTKKLRRAIDTIDIVNLGNCSGKVKSRFAKEVTKLLDNDEYEEIAIHSAGKEQTHVMFRTEGEDITEIVIAAVEKKDAAFVRITGLITHDDIEQILELYQD